MKIKFTKGLRYLDETDLLWTQVALNLEFKVLLFSFVKIRSYPSLLLFVVWLIFVFLGFGKLNHLTWPHLPNI